MQFLQRQRLWLPVLAEVIFLIFALGCHRNGARQSTASAYPLAVDPEKVGSYPALTKSGAGHFYDDVLEYRVWINPPEGGDDYYHAFARYEDALSFSRKTLGAEEPLVLILQKQWIDEPEPGAFFVQNEDRITEWQVQWLSTASEHRERSSASWRSIRRMGSEAKAKSRRRHSGPT